MFGFTDVVIGIGLLVAFFLIFRRRESGGGAQEGDARARAEAIAEERKAEIERLNSDLSEAQNKQNENEDQRRKDEARIASLETELRKEQEKASETKSQIDEKKQEIDTLKQRLEGERDKRERLTGENKKLQAERNAQEEAAKKMNAEFGELARKELKEQREEFSKVNMEKLTTLLDPLKKDIGNFEREIKTMRDKTIEERATLKNKIETLTKRSESISQEATALTRALKSDQQKQGAWGEMILSKILEDSGLEEGVEYKVQANLTGAEGERLRPDVVVQIPGGKSLVIDSKVSLNAYTEAVNAENDEDIASARKRNVQSLKAHINRLSEKNYHQFTENVSVNFVILFVPIEGAFSEAFREDKELTEYAHKRNIMIATPTTLMMTLKTVARVWDVEKRNKNAEEIAMRAGRLYEKVAGFVESMKKVGSGLHDAQKSYDKAWSQLSQGSGNLLGQTQKLKALGADTTKSIKADFDQEDTPEQIEASEPPLLSNEENEENEE